MTDYLKPSQVLGRHQENEGPIPNKNPGDLSHSKRPIVSDGSRASKKQKVDAFDPTSHSSQIESIPNNPNLDSVLHVLFPNDKTTASLIQKEAEKNFQIGLPYVIGERQLEKNSFVYDNSRVMARMYSHLRNYEEKAISQPPPIDMNIIENDRYFLFPGRTDPVISLGRARELEEKGLGLTDIDSILRFSGFHEAADHHLLLMARLTLSLLFETNVLADTKGIDSSKFSSMIPAKEKEERYFDLMASSACDDGSPIFSLLLAKGMDPFRKSILFEKTPAQMAARDNAQNNLALLTVIAKKRSV